jgi:hypothetical protein
MSSVTAVNEVVSGMTLPRLAQFRLTIFRVRDFDYGVRPIILWDGSHICPCFLEGRLRHRTLTLPVR